MSSLLEELSAGEVLHVEVDGKRLRLTNLGKVLWPRSGTQKRELLSYYASIGPVLLPHIAGRPLTLLRCPDGVEEANWFQTSCPHPPQWMRTHPVPKRTGEGLAAEYCVVDDLAGLLWAANLGAIELHPLMSMSERPGEALVLVLDLDPGPGTSVFTCARVASLLRGMLEDMSLTAFPKTSGSVGIHLFVPLNSGAKYEATKSVARKLARSLAERHPDLVTDRIEPRARVGKVLIDWRQNGPNTSTVAPYSLRAMLWPTASIPLTWEEIEAIGAGNGDAVPIDGEDALYRVKSRGDLFVSVIHMCQELPSP